jgi:two-component system, OmpR family, response regulator
MLPLGTSRFTAENPRMTVANIENSLSQYRILVVDDFEDALQALSQLLQMHSFEVAATTSARQALNMASTFCPDAIILDLEMPDMDGYEVCRRLRASLTTRDALYIACSGVAGQEPDRLAQTGFDLYIVKPADPLRLIEVIRAALKTRSSSKKH